MYSSVCGVKMPKTTVFGSSTLSVLSPIPVSASGVVVSNLGSLEVIIVPIGRL